MCKLVAEQARPASSGVTVRHVQKRGTLKSYYRSLVEFIALCLVLWSTGNLQSYLYKSSREVLN